MEISFLGKSNFKLKGKTVVVGTDPFEVVTDKVFKIEYPGEYEISGVSIIGIPVDAKNTINVVEIDGLRIAYISNLGEKLSTQLLEEIGSIDILLITVADVKLALEVIKQVDPWVAIPMNFDDVTEFLKAMDKPSLEPLAKYVVSADRLPAEFTLVWLQKK
jgi:Beta-lactamase superfamily domain